MTWKNLAEVYLPKTGGTVSGNLNVTGNLQVANNLTINDKTGKGTYYNVASEFADLKSSVTRKLWSGKLRSESLSIPNLKSFSLIAIQFDTSNSFTVISTDDGDYQAGTAWLNGYDVWGVSCYVSISGTTITFSNQVYGRYQASSLGNYLAFNAGDGSQVISIYGI